MSFLLTQQPAALATYYHVRPDIAALHLYCGDAMVDDRVWCGCGDEIILSHSVLGDPVFYGPNGQYCCWICAETSYAHLHLKAYEPGPQPVTQDGW